MFRGTSIDELIAMVKQAEQHAIEIEEPEEQPGPALIYEAQRIETLVGVA